MPRSGYRVRSCENARSFTVEKDRGRTLLRGYEVLHDERVFQAALSGPKGFVEGKDAKEFLDSFRVGK